MPCILLSYRGARGVAVGVGTQLATCATDFEEARWKQGRRAPGLGVRFSLTSWDEDDIGIRFCGRVFCSDALGCDVIQMLRGDNVQSWLSGTGSIKRDMLDSESQCSL